MIRHARRHDDGGPDDEATAPTELQEAVLTLLEEAGISTAINDKICALIEVGEAELCGEPPDAESQPICDPLYGERMDSADLGEN